MDGADSNVFPSSVGASTLVLRIASEKIILHGSVNL